MKIILAPDSFKGNLTASQVATAYEKGVKRVVANAECVKIPMADGGEGTVQAVVAATGGKIIRRTVVGPIGKPVRARYGVLPDGKTAIIEMAEASGLPLVDEADRKPMKTTTYGTGELMLSALRQGVKKIIIGIGGSATNDGGMGMAQALGVVFHNRQGRLIQGLGCGKLLGDIASIDCTGLAPELAQTKVIVACDVNSPLYGKQGASVVFGPQKGATKEMVKKLDMNLRYYSQIIKRTLNKDIARVKGAGAAGGLGAGLMVFANAEMKKGIDTVIELVGMRQHLKNATLVITGEGQVDRQTGTGKTPAGVANLAAKFGIPVIVVGGCITDNARYLFQYGIDGLESACARNMDLQEAISYSRVHLANATERALRLVLIGRKLS